MDVVHFGFCSAPDSGERRVEAEAAQARVQLCSTTMLPNVSTTRRLNAQQRSKSSLLVSSRLQMSQRARAIDSSAAAAAQVKSRLQTSDLEFWRHRPLGGLAALCS